VAGLVRGKGNRSMWRLRGRVSWVFTWGDGGGDGNLWDIGTVDDGGVTIGQLTT